MTPFFRFLAYACAGYALMTGVMFLAQRRMMYYPKSSAPVLDMAGVPEMSAVTLETADGLELLAWHRAPSREGLPTLIYLHGNAGHIGQRGGKVRPYLDAGYGVLLVSWRGYGGNPGSPTEEGLYHDARAALDFLDARGVAPGRMVVYGESIGSGPAVQVATERKVGALVLEAPLFIVHGERDRVVPVDMGRSLLAAANEPKDARFFAEAGHNNLYEFGAAAAVIDFLKRTFP